MDFNIAALLLAALIAFVWIGLRARTGQTDLDDYITARNSQSASTLTLSFVASGLGAWILFVPPEIGAFVGPIALAGYALAAALPFVVLIWFGPAIRQRMPLGRSLAEYAEHRFGTAMRLWLTSLSLLYMLCFITAELTALSVIAGMTVKVPGSWIMIGVAITTLVYTTVGGLRASLATDRLQGILVLALIALVCASLAWSSQGAPIELRPMPTAPVSQGLGVALTLIIAVTAANLFHQGYWQRIWSARDDQTLKVGSAWAALLTTLVILLVGGMGILAVMMGKPLGTPPAPFFALVHDSSPWMAALVILLATALVASSIDSLQNALASLIVTCRPNPGAGSIRSARWLTVVLMVPVVLVALEGISVLRIFLIADLLCATAIVPTLMGLWKRMTPLGAMAGCIAGLLGAVAPGWIESGQWVSGVVQATFPDNTPTLAPFVGALLASALVAMAVAPLGSRRHEAKL